MPRPRSEKKEGKVIGKELNGLRIDLGRSLIGADVCAAALFALA